MEKFTPFQEVLQDFELLFSGTLSVYLAYDKKRITNNKNLTIYRKDSYHKQDVYIHESIVFRSSDVIVEHDWEKEFDRFVFCSNNITIGYINRNNVHIIEEGDVIEFYFPDNIIYSLSYS
jgi:hypothetical protein